MRRALAAPALSKKFTPEAYAAFMSEYADSSLTWGPNVTHDPSESRLTISPDFPRRESTRKMRCHVGGGDRDSTRDLHCILGAAAALGVGTAVAAEEVGISEDAILAESASNTIIQ